MAPTFARFRRRLTAFLAKLYTTHQRFDPIVVGQGVFFRIDYLKIDQRIWISRLSSAVTYLESGHKFKPLGFLRGSMA